MCTLKLSSVIAGNDAFATDGTERELGLVMLRRATSETMAHSDRQHSANMASQPSQLLSQHSSGAALPADALTVSTHPDETVQPARPVASPAGPAEAAAAAGGEAAGGAAAGASQPTQAAVAASADVAEEAREKRRRRVAAQLKDLQQCYLALRSKQAPLELDQLPLQASAAASPPTLSLPPC